MLRNRISILLSLLIFSSAAYLAAEPLYELEKLPVLPRGVRAYQISSYDRGGGNDDGNRKYAYIEYDRQSREFTIFRAYGPGRLLRFWMTGWRNPDTLSFYRNQRNDPFLHVPVLEIFSGTHPEFPENLVGDDEKSSGGFYSYVPISFFEGLEIRTERISRYIQLTYHLYENDSALRNKGLPDITFSAGEKTVQDAHFNIPFGSTDSLFRYEGGGGFVEELILNIDGTAPDLSSVYVTAAFDNSPEPQIKTTLSHLAGGTLSGERVSAAVVDVKRIHGGVSIAFRLPMPFSSSVEISLASEDITLTGNARMSIVSSPGMAAALKENKAGYLHGSMKKTVFHGEPLSPDSAELGYIAGYGKLVGSVLTVEGKDPENRRILEGDDRIFIDGAATPQLHGTGTEDFFNGGWYYNRGPFTLDLHGHPVYRNNGDSDITTQYRFLLNDFIPFYSSLKFTMEHGPGNDEEGTFISTLFWYGHSSPVLKQITHVSDYNDALSAPLLGTPDMTPVTYNGAEFSGNRSITVEISKDADGILLRRKVDISKGNQCVAVSVDGVPAGTWYTPGFSPFPAFENTEFQIPVSFIQNKNQIKISFSPEEESDSFTEYGMRVFEYSY